MCQLHSVRFDIPVPKKQESRLLGRYEARSVNMALSGTDRLILPEYPDFHRYLPKSQVAVLQAKYAAIKNDSRFNATPSQKETLDVLEKELLNRYERLELHHLISWLLTLVAEFKQQNLHQHLPTVQNAQELKPISNLVYYALVKKFNTMSPLAIADVNGGAKNSHWQMALEAYVLDDNTLCPVVDGIIDCYMYYLALSLSKYPQLAGEFDRIFTRGIQSRQINSSHLHPEVVSALKHKWTLAKSGVNALHPLQESLSYFPPTVSPQRQTMLHYIYNILSRTLEAFCQLTCIETLEYAPKWMRLKLQELCVWSMDNNHLIRKCTITGLGSGTAMVGVMEACDKIFGNKIPKAWTAVLGVTALITSATVNIIASGDLKDHNIRHTDINKGFLFVLYAAITSGVLSFGGGQSLMLNLLDKDQLSGNEETIGTFLGIIFMSFNIFTSYRSTSSSSIGFFNSCITPNSHLNQLRQTPPKDLTDRYRRLTLKGALYLTGVITSVMAAVYSTPITNQITGVQYLKDNMKRCLPIFVISLIANFTTASIFYNRTIEMLYSLISQSTNNTNQVELVSSRTHYLIIIFMFSIFAPFYVLSAYGNGVETGEQFFDDIRLQQLTGILSAVSGTPSAIKTAITLADQFIVRKWGAVEPSLNEATDDEETPLLPSHSTPPASNVSQSWSEWFCSFFYS